MSVRLAFALCAAFIACLLRTEASLLFENARPSRFARERYERSRNLTRDTARTHRQPSSIQVLDFVGLVNQFGYPAEEHLITTLDGYKLRVHRIPGSPSRPKSGGKPIVFFQHGLLASSDTWVLMGPGKDFAYTLADAGYDIWLGNARGNTYSRAHVRLSPDYDPEFWQFSFHEIALYDVTAMVDYMLGLTGQRSIIYIGHSMGTTISYVLLSIRPEYNDKMELVISLSPVAFWRAPPRPFIKFLMDNAVAIKNFVINTRIYEVFPLTTATGQLAKSTCSNDSVFQQICLNLIYYLSGYNPGQLDTAEVPRFLSYFPAGASTKTLIHYSQNMLSGEFRMYDYGLIQNFAVYGQEKPTEYNLKNITAPVALFYGQGDVIVSPGNAIELSRKLPNVVAIESVSDDKFGHLNFLFSRDIKTLLNDRIYEVMTKVLRTGSAL